MFSFYSTCAKEHPLIYCSYVCDVEPLENNKKISKIFKTSTLIKKILNFIHCILFFLIEVVSYFNPDLLNMKTFILLCYIRNDSLIFAIITKIFLILFSLLVQQKCSKGHSIELCKEILSLKDIHGGELSSSDKIFQLVGCIAFLILIMYHYYFNNNYFISRFISLIILNYNCFA